MGTRTHRPAPAGRTCLVTLTTLLLVLGACSEFKGPRAPNDALYYPVGVAVHPSGEYLYVSNANFDTQYRTDVGGTVTVLRADTLTIVPESTIEIGSFAGAVRLNHGRDFQSSPDRLYVAVRGDDSIVALDLSSDGSVLTCPNAAPGVTHALDCRVSVEEDPFSLALLDPIAAYRNHALRVDPRCVDETPPEDLDCPPTPATTDYDVIAAVGIDGHVSYVTLSRDDERFLIDDANVEESLLIAGASTIRYFGPTDEMWVAGRYSRRLLGTTPVFDPNAFAFADQVLDVVEIVVSNETRVPSTFDTSEVRDMVFADDGTRAYVTMNRPSAILVLDMTLDADGDARATPLERFDVDGSPAEMVLLEEGGRDVIYTALSADESLAVYDAETGILRDLIQLDGLAYGLAHDPVNQRIYVTLFDEHAVVAIDVDPSSPNFRHVVERTR